MYKIIEYITGLITFYLCAIGISAVAALMVLFAPVITLFIIEKE